MARFARAFVTTAKAVGSKGKHEETASHRMIHAIKDAAGPLDGGRGLTDNTARRIHNAVLDAVRAELKDTGKATLSGLGVLRVKRAAERSIPTKPGSTQRTKLAERNVLRFKASKTKDISNDIATWKVFEGKTPASAISKGAKVKK